MFGYTICQKQIALSADFEYQVQIVQIVQQTSHGDIIIVMIKIRNNKNQKINKLK